MKRDDVCVGALYTVKHCTGKVVSQIPQTKILLYSSWLISDTPPS